MNVLAIDIGGTNIKILASLQKEPHKFPSGPTLSSRQVMDGVQKLAAGWNYDVVSPSLVDQKSLENPPAQQAKG
jgi:polyphosphate glucokinase